MTPNADQLLRVIEARLETVMEAVASEVFRRLVTRSPVDTGRFRANWRVGIGAPDTSTSEATDKDGSSTIRSGQAAIAGAEPGQSIAMTNSLPYARALEYGHSTQAPAGMVAITAMELPHIVDEAVRQARNRA